MKSGKIDLINCTSGQDLIDDGLAYKKVRQTIIYQVILY
jgi:hypothetical protein